MEISVYASDVKDLDEELDRKFNIKQEYGELIFRKDGRLHPQADYLAQGGYYVDPHSYLGILQDLQHQILWLQEEQRAQEHYINVYKQALEINRDLKRKNDKLEEKIKELMEIIEELVNAQETTDKQIS